MILKKSRNNNIDLTFLEEWIFPLLLLIYPLLNINQGIDLTDTTYSLGNYRFFADMDGMWTIATYLSNVAGFLMSKLPFGNTLIGMRFYTGLIPGLCAVFSYKKLGRYISHGVLFVGELIALSYCWCPTTILYNYLTYLLFNMALILLFDGILLDSEEDKAVNNKDNDSNKCLVGKKSNICLVLAGVLLGLNVMVRFSNLPQMSLILVLWFAMLLQKKNFKELAVNTLWCILGYAIGFIIPLIIIMFQYGASSYADMIGSLFGMTSSASDYTLLGMLNDIISAYIVSIKWLVILLVCSGGGMLVYMCIEEGHFFEKARNGKSHRNLQLAVIGANIAGLLVILRYYWGNGMFTFNYYDYTSIFQWGMLFLICGIAASVYMLCQGEYAQKVLALGTLIVILITPIGSNNYTFPNLNNLFIVAPFTIYSFISVVERLCNGQISELFEKKRFEKLPFALAVCLIITMTLFQGVLFHSQYVFRDGNAGGEHIFDRVRTAKIENNSALKGMWTTLDKAEPLQEFVDFANSNEIVADAENLLYWGDMPGMSYVLDKPSAIYTSWPEIPSNTLEALTEALVELESTSPEGGLPVIVMHHEPAFMYAEDEKGALIRDFVERNNYDIIFLNDYYCVMSNN